MMKNVFISPQEQFLFLGYLSFCCDFFGYVEKCVDKKAKSYIKIYDFFNGKTNTCNKHIVQCLKKETNQ